MYVPDHPPVQKSHPKLLISKAAVDGIVAPGSFFLFSFFAEKAEIHEANHHWQKFGGTLSKMTLQGPQKKTIVFLVSFYNPLKYSAGFFPFQVTFFGG